MSDASAKPRKFDSQLEQLGVIYAKGLLGAAQAQNRAEQVLEELDSVVVDVLNKLPDLEAFLASPRVNVDVKQQALDRIFAGKMSPLLLNFLKVVARHLRLDCLRQIHSACKDLYNEITGRVEIAIHTATPVDATVLSEISNSLTATLGCSVDLQLSVNDDLLGGLVVRVGDTVYDGSLSNRLARMRQETLENASELVRDSLEQFLVTEQ